MTVANKGINIKQTGKTITLMEYLTTSAGAAVTSGTTFMYLGEVQSDGSTKTFDFTNSTFGSGAVTAATISRSRSLVSSRSTKLRSIFRTSTGNCRR